MKSFRCLVMTAALLTIPPLAGAAPWIESGDAGDSLATSDVVTVPAPSMILGNIENPTDADLFALYLTAGVPFSATSVDSGGAAAILDTQLFLFGATGLGLRFNDDITVIDFFSSISFTPLISGVYYLGISAVGFNPIDGDGDFIYVRDPADPSATPGPSAFGPLASWAPDGSGVTDLGDFQINLAGASAVPEPNTLLLLLGLAGLAAGRRFVVRR